MNPDWSERPEAGSPHAIARAIALARSIGRSAARILLGPVMLWIFCVRGPERRASRAFLGRAFGRPAHAWEILRHMYVYAATMLDRVFLLSESFRRFDVRSQGLEQLDAALEQGRGVLLLSAHIGSFEALRVLGEQRPEVPISIVMDRRQTPGLTAALQALNPRFGAAIIDAGGDPAELALAMQAAAGRGALIGLLADRARPGEALHEVEFFGERAAFPVGPYLIAALLGVPVVLCFGLYRGGNRYDLYFETFAERLQLARATRAAQLGECAQRFAGRLEHYTRQNPYNWFNFYDFWHARPDLRAPRRGRVDAVSGSA